MSLPDASNASLVSAVGGLLRQAGLDEGRYDLVPLSGGANNQVYRLEFAARAPLVLKHYFFSPEDRRDRFHSEKSFYDVLQASGLPPQTPVALAWDREHRLGLFSWIEGRRLLGSEVNLAFVDQALGFYLALNAQRNSVDSTAVPSASEACFDLGEHFACVERRLSRLAQVEGDSDLNRAAVDFISNQLKPAFEKYRETSAVSELVGMPALQSSQRYLSPSDFGFHNALLQADGRLVFFDFEYAGWDDPAKFLCDFLCQPAVPVPRPLWAHCVQSLCRPIPGGTRPERIALLLPLYQLKWCCILLNEFLPQEQHRRVFAHKYSIPEIEAGKSVQLGKAGNLLANLTSGPLT
jgi:hypothetical protein